MGLMAFTDRAGMGNYSFAQPGERIHLLVTVEQVASVASPQGGADCVLYTSDGREYEVREEISAIQAAMQAGSLLG